VRGVGHPDQGADADSAAFDDGMAFADAADAGHDLPGGAVAALEDVLVDERLSQRV